MHTPSRITLLTLSLLLGVAALSADDHPAPRLILSPKVALVGGVRIEAHVPRHKDHRLLRLEVDGPSFFRSSQEQLEGEQARVTFPPLTIPSLPDGRYSVTLAVFHNDGKVDVIAQMICRGQGCFEEGIADE